MSNYIRHEVEPLLDVAEIEDLALRYLAEQLPALPDSRVLVIGTGVVGQGLMEDLLRRGCHCVWAYHRNAPASSAQDAHQIEVIQLRDLARVLPTIDAVVSAVNASEPVLNRLEHGARLNPRGVTLIDLGMPRNIDPALDTFGNGVRVADLDEIKRWYRSANGTLDKVLKACDAILREHRSLYERMRRSVQGEHETGEERRTLNVER